MKDTATHLVDWVLPEVAIRQWVLTLPYPLRYPCAWNARLASEAPRASAPRHPQWTLRLSHVHSTLWVGPMEDRAIGWDAGHARHVHQAAIATAKLSNHATRP
jgi:hypothetical protein